VSNVFASIVCSPPLLSRMQEDSLANPVTKRTTMHIFACRAIREVKGAGILPALDNVDDKLLCKAA
jgi:hypothetical protein